MDNLIYDQEDHMVISPTKLDTMLAEGWRHFGRYFFRYNMNLYENKICKVLPLRIRLKQFNYTKRLRKIKRKGEQFSITVQEASVDWHKEELFEKHKQKFKTSKPNSIYDFISFEPANIPCKALEVTVHDGPKLIAWSVFDLAKKSISSIYGMYDLDYQQYSLGIFTMLVELDYAIEQKKVYYYHGYSYDQPSFYDYKKRFPGVEYYNWKQRWKPLEG